MKRRHLVWLLVLALVLGLGWFKSDQNRREAQAQAAWREQIVVLEGQSAVRYEELKAWAATLYSDPDARAAIAQKLEGARRPEVQPLAREFKAQDNLKYELDKYGIEFEFQFSDGRLISQASRRSVPALAAANPPPQSFAHEGPAESVRRWVPLCAIVFWLALLPVAIFWRRWGLVAAEAMLMLVLAGGTAWLVSPSYDLTPHGIFSNDVLFYAVVAYMASLVILTWRLAGASDRPRKLQFSLRALLAVTTLAAILLAMGAIGYVALGTLAAGSIFVLVTLSIGSGRAPRVRSI
jgi:hypothetical protein